MTKILIVEDVDDIRENSCELLELNGFEVISANNGLTALDVLSTQDVDLIICDIVMPDMNGFQFIDRLREHEEYSKIPFIFMSASVQEKEKQLALSKGINGFIHKPFTEEVLLSTIEEVLKNS